MNTLTQLEKEILHITPLPDPAPEFLSNLASRIATPFNPKPKPQARIRLAWAAMAIIVFVLLSVAMIGPGKVWAQIQSWLGLLPGVGLIEPDTPIRVLKETVSQTRDGITVEVYKAALTPKQSFIYYNIFDLPSSAYSGDESQPGCIIPQYLETDDGQRFEAFSDSEYEQIPPETNALTLVIPCLRNTLAGTTPEDWRFLLEFVPSEGPLELTPVYVFPTATPLPTSEQSEQTPVVENEIQIVVSHSLMEGKDLVLGGYIRGLEEKYRNLIGDLQLFDADGHLVPFIYDLHQTGLQNALSNHIGSWVIRFKPEMVAFPLEIRQSYVEISSALKGERASLTLTFPDEYSLNDLSVNQSIEIAGESMELYFVRAQPSQFGGYQYDFYFKEHPVIKNLEVSMQGIPSLPQTTCIRCSEMHGEPVFMSSVWMETGALHGNVSVEFGKPVKVIETVTLTQSFTPPADLLSQIHSAADEDQACIDFLNVSERDNSDGTMPNGKVLIYQEIAPFEGYGLVLYDLDGSERKIIGNNLTHSEISPDGKTIVYFMRDKGLWLFDIASESSKQISDLQGSDLRWSPDGKWIAFQSFAGATIMSSDGSQILKQSEQGVGNIVGWSADSLRLYFRKASSNDSQGRLFVYSLQTGKTELFEMIDAESFISRSFTISPDEQSAVYVQSGQNWVLDNFRTGEVKQLSNGITLYDPVWLENGWILFNLYDPIRGTNGAPLMINPDTCEVIHLPEELSGQVFGVWLDQ